MPKEVEIDMNIDLVTSFVTNFTSLTQRIKTNFVLDECQNYDNILFLCLLLKNVEP